MRQLMFNGSQRLPFLTWQVELGILVLLAAGFIVTARWALHYMEELGKKEGRLTLRWQ